MKRQALSFFIIFTTFFAYYVVRHISFDNQTIIEQRHKTIVVGTNAEYKPFAFVDEHNTITGFDIDVMNSVAQKIGLTVEYKDLPFEALMGELYNGTIDCMIGGINPTPERARQVLFTHPVYANDPLIIVYPKAGMPFRTIKDLANAKVIVNEGYFADSFLTDQKDIFLIRLSSNLPSDGLLALQNGQAQAFVGSKSTTLQVFNKQQKKIFDITVINEVVEQDAFAVSRNNQELLILLNNAIQTLQKNGTLNILQNKWFFTDGADI